VIIAVIAAIRAADIRMVSFILLDQFPDSQSPCMASRHRAVLKPDALPLLALEYRPSGVS